MNKHQHIEENHAQKIASEMLKGQTDLIVACHQCRDKITEQLYVLTENESGAKRDLAILHRYQMEIVASNYRQAIRQLPDTQFEQNRFETLSRRPVLNDQNQLAKNQSAREAT